MRIQHGEAVGARSDWLGPAPWPVMVSAAAQAGLALEEGDGGGVQATFTDGWLRLLEADEAVVAALQAAIARHGGRAAQRRAWSAQARVAAGEVGVEGRVESSTIAPNGALWTQPVTPVSLPVALEDESVPEGALRELLDEAEGAVVRLTRILDGPLAQLHPDLAWRDARLRVPSGWAPPSGVVVELEGEVVPDPAVARMLGALGRRLDATGKAPDLERWTWRAARRAGLAGPVAPGAEGWEVYHATWLELSARDRAQPAATGKVAAWRFRSDGEWIVPAAECALLAEVAEEPWRAVLRRGAGGEGCRLRCARDASVGEPWHLEPVALQTRGERLVVVVGDQVLVEAVREDEEIRVLRADGMEPEVASSSLRAALQRR